MPKVETYFCREGLFHEGNYHCSADHFQPCPYKKEEVEHDSNGALIIKECRLFNPNHILSQELHKIAERKDNRSC